MLSRFLVPLTPYAYALMRIITGVMFAFHGLQKIFGVMTDRQTEFGTQIWIGGLIELVGGLAIALGAGTVWAAFLCSGTMAVAYTQFHWKFQMGEKFFPAMNKGEMALAYCVVFFYIACRGSGILSVDRLLGRKSGKSG